MIIRSAQEIDNIQYPVLEEELFHWESYIDSTKLESENGLFTIYHSYSLDLLFLITKANEVLSFFSSIDRYTKSEFFERMNDNGSESYKKRIEYLSTMLEGEELLSFFKS